MLRPLEDRYISTEPQLRNMMAFAMGGRAAEEVLFGQASSGAHNDLENATRVARTMVSELGMSDRLGPVSFGRDGFRGADGQILYPGARPDISEETAKLIDEEVTRILKDEFGRARKILEEKKDLLSRLSQLLMVRETLEGDELKGYVDGSLPIPDLEEERTRLDAERAEQERKDEQKRKAEAAANPPPPPTEEIPPPPGVREPSDELGRR
jgi:cell division protease FtsH